MSRIIGLVFHNWPLKLAAIVLATMLYAGFVLSQSVQEFTGSVLVRPINVPTDAFYGTNPPQVTRIRYIAVGNASARASADSFQATMDLGDVDPEAGPTYVPFRVQSVDPRFTVVSFEPPGISVTLDPLKVRTDIPVRVVPGTTPDELDVRPAVVTPEKVSIRGPASVVDRVARVEANVVIEPSGLNVDRDVELIPVDELGDRVTPVDVEPATAHVRIDVFNNLQSRPLPVAPEVSGVPAGGYEITSITVNPLLVTVEGEADLLVNLSSAPTAAVSISGATQNVVQNVALALPEGVLPVGGETTVRVTVTIRPISSTRTYDAAVVLAGVASDFDYRLSFSHALATVGGPLADLDRLDGASFVLEADVSSLTAGSHEVTLTANLPLGLTLSTVQPAIVTVTIVPLASPNPPASPAASP
ncbi:MAG TPA: CdaR family protein [Candidatus Limnocylindrales bacterium]|nr:CdaR family protein [Candidatus Limnocylindrales bacterium]